MELPRLAYTASKRLRQTVRFGTLQLGRSGGDGDFAATVNLSARLYPSLSQRRPRERDSSHEKATALFAKNCLALVDGEDFLYDGKSVGKVTPGEKTILSVGSKILIFPDKLYYDTAADLFGSMAAHVEAQSSQVTWSSDRVKITGQGDLTKIFLSGQGIKISGSSRGKNNATLVVHEVTADTLVFQADRFETGGESNTVHFEREIPDFLCACESANRLWGADQEGTIWASALGDPLTFYAYEGLSTDSFAVAVGTDGAFTGCSAYSSNVLFFKEGVLHKVMGAAPSEYRVYDYTIPGVQAGSEKSLVTINETLYYKGTDGVYAFTGATPTLITENFGTRRFVEASAGTDGSGYYISMRDAATETWGLYVYDTKTGIWLQEDDTHVVDFAVADGAMHFLGADGVISKVVEEGGDEPFSWQAEFFPLDDTTYGKRGYGKLWLRLELEQGAWVKAELREDDGPWRHAGTWSGGRRQSVTAHLFPGRCESFRVRLSGWGRCLVKGMVREFDVGSED